MQETVLDNGKQVSELKDQLSRITHQHQTVTQELEEEKERTRRGKGVVR